MLLYLAKIMRDQRIPRLDYWQRVGLVIIGHCRTNTLKCRSYREWKGELCKFSCAIPKLELGMFLNINPFTDISHKM